MRAKPGDWDRVAVLAHNEFIGRNSGEKSKWEAWHWISVAERPELLPIAMEFLDNSREPSIQRAVLSYLYKLAPTREAVNELIVGLLTRQEFRGATIIALWASGATEPPSKAQLDKLSKSECLWVRALSHAASIGSARGVKNHSVRQSVRKLISQDAPEEVRALITQLDSPSYRLREDAGAALLRSGDAGEIAIAHDLSRQCSAETRQRLGCILNRMRDEDLRSDALTAVNCLAQFPTEEAKELLEEIARGPERFRATIAAKNALAHRHFGERR